MRENTKDKTYWKAIEQKQIIESLFIVHSDIDNDLANKLLIQLYQLNSDILANVEK